MSRIFTISELNGRIKERLDTDARLHDLWARGELSNVVNHRSGHRYFTLKDGESQISCALFRAAAGRLGFELEDGQNVLVFGDIDFYRPRGQAQLIARGIKLDSGLGFRYLEFERLKKKLSSEGLFDLEHKRDLPKYPGRIGIVTSPDGAALRDVLKIIGSYPARIIISPALVQGDGSPESIALAIKALKGRADVVIVCRGGGSVEDLWSFNHESVARAIYECDCPVISAIGHETDVTIADFVADVRAATPTAAAEMAVPDVEEISVRLAEIGERMIRALYACAELKKNRLEYLERSLSTRRMYSLVGESRQRLDYLAEHMQSAELQRVQMLRGRMELAGGKLAAVSPLATLSRGYVLARTPEGRLVSSAGSAKPGELIEVVFADGKLCCRVKRRLL
ncbi:MAG TPA: exodeoxyribonuclease VII large subunit [Methanotrichaceae archaeon]|nr:exodeoxyribonuclease VII large subunit [Methanotrichaceae archaeon]